MFVRAYSLYPKKSPFSTIIELAFLTSETDRYALFHLLWTLRAPVILERILTGRFHILIEDTCLKQVFKEFTSLFCRKSGKE